MNFLFCSQWRQFFFVRKLLKTVCFDCEVTLFWQNLLKAVCFGKNFFLRIAGEYSRFCQNTFTYSYSVMVIFTFLGQNGLKLELRSFAVHKIVMEH